MGAWSDKIMDSDAALDCADMLYERAGLNHDADDFDQSSAEVSKSLSEGYDKLIQFIDGNFQATSVISRDKAHQVLLVLMILADCILPKALLESIATVSSPLGQEELDRQACLEY